MVMATAKVERRLAAILAADVAGYSRLMERDEAGTVARLKAIRQELVEPVLARHGGRFVDLKGDGAIVEFGSVVAAVEAAVEIQRAMAAREADRPEQERIRYRIGINLGDVIVEGEDIYGDGVNVAARIEGLCEPGGVWVAARVHDPVRASSTCRSSRRGGTGSRTSASRSRPSGSGSRGGRCAAGL
jgi:adenylate cyclase